MPVPSPLGSIPESLAVLSRLNLAGGPDTVNVTKVPVCETLSDAAGGASSETFGRRVQFRKREQ